MSAPQNAPAPSPEVLPVDLTRIARMFRFVRISHFYLVLGGVSSGFATLQTLLASGLDLQMLLFAAVSSGVYGYCLWVGWNSIGILEAVLRPEALRAFVILGFYSAFLAVLSFFASGGFSIDTPEGRAVGVGAFSHAFMAATALVGV